MKWANGNGHILVTCHTGFQFQNHLKNSIINQLKRKGFNYDKENIVPEKVAESK